MKTLEFLTDSQILNLKVKDLELKLTSEQRDVIKVLYSLLASKGIKWKPHIWLSDEWFSPDGISGFAIPFTLGHKRLVKLEKKFLGHCEGESKKEFLKLCCHETGHAIDNAFKLRLNKERQKLFGLSSKKYPSSYIPDPSSNDYLPFLEDHYAQAHPDEDWAETFAFMLMGKKINPEITNTKAYEKLNLVKKIVSNLSTKNFKVNKERTPLNYKYDNRTIGQYLEEKKRSLKIDQSNYYEKRVTKNFTKKTNQQYVSSFMYFNKTRILEKIQKQTKNTPWIINKCFNELKQECKTKQYTLRYNNSDSLREIEFIISKSLNEYVKEGRTRIYM